MKNPFIPTRNSVDGAEPALHKKEHRKPVQLLDSHHNRRKARVLTHNSVDGAELAM